jgi:hypothetical protein
MDAARFRCTALYDRIQVRSMRSFFRIFLPRFFLLMQRGDKHD